MGRDTWYRLDNVGKFYASQAGGSSQTVFRCAVTLADEVDPDILQHAVNEAVDEFPSFNVCLRRGIFWHYLEQASEPPAVHPENLPICFGLHIHAKSILFRVSYYRTRINLEVSHIISDGRGALSFLRVLVYAYARERYGIEGITLEYDGSDHQKAEDSFNKYFERDKAGSMRRPKVYRLPGWRDVSAPTFIECHLPAQRVLDLAHSYNVSLTSLVITAIICAIRPEMSHRDRRHAIRLGIPVDLRQFFESSTIKNFFGMMYLSYIPGETDESPEDVASQVHTELKAGAQAENLKQRMNRMIALEKNPLLRLAPLFVKNLALEAAKRMSARDSTATVSSLGVIHIDDRLAPFVHNISILTSTTDLNFIACTFDDDLCIGISTAYANLDVIKNFCRYFSSQGIEGRININKTGVEEPRAPQRMKEGTARHVDHPRTAPLAREVGEGGNVQSEMDAHFEAVTCPADGCSADGSSTDAGPAEEGRAGGGER